MRTVYMFRAIGMNTVKIGCCYTDRLHTRLRQVARDYPALLYIAGVLPGPFGVETGLHRRFRCFSLGGEWFDQADLIMKLTFKLDGSASKPYGYRQTIIWQETQNEEWRQEILMVLKLA